MLKNSGDIKRVRALGAQRNSYIFENISTELQNYPDFLTLKEEAFDKLISLGFSIEQTSPKHANCIIRLFSNKRHTKNSFVPFQMIYGYNYYTKSSNTWLTQATNKQEIQIDFSRCKFYVWYFQDEYTGYECDFLDCYVKLTQVKVKHLDLS